MSLRSFIEYLILSTYGVAHRAILRRRTSAEQPLSPAQKTVPDDAFLVGHRLDPTQPHVPSASGEPASVRKEDLLTHLLLSGGSGRGKTNTILGLIRYVLRQRINLLIVDQQGDLCDAVLRLLVAEGWEAGYDRIGIFDLRPGNAYVVGMNGLIGPGDPFTKAEQIVAAWRSVAEGWGVTIDDAARATLALLAHVPQEAALTNIESVLTVAAYRAELLQRLPDTVATIPIRSWFSRYASLSEERRTALWMPLCNKLSALLIGDVRLALAETERPLPLHQLLDHPDGSVTLLCLDAARLQGAAKFLGGVLLSMIENHILARASVPEEQRRQVQIILDEFPSLPTERFMTPIALFRRMRAGLCLAVQNQSQLDSQVRTTLRANCSTRLYLGTGSGADASDIASDIVLPGLHREQVQNLLLTQGRGRAIACMPGEPYAAWVQIPHHPLPAVPDEAVRALTDKSLRAFGRPREEAEQRLLERARRLRTHDTEPSSAPSIPRPSDRPADAGTTDARRFEVREVRQ